MQRKRCPDCGSTRPSPLERFRRVLEELDGSLGDAVSWFDPPGEANLTLPVEVRARPVRSVR